MHPAEKYFSDLRAIRGTNASDELSYYTALSRLFNSVGEKLSPTVVFVAQPKGVEDARPDGGFYTETDLQDADAPDPGSLLADRKPSHGVVEVKGTGVDLSELAASPQVRKYLRRYGQVLITNYRQFSLLRAGESGDAVELESFSLTATEGDFWQGVSRPRNMSQLFGDDLLAYLKRAILRSAPITDPKDLAALLAAYARRAKESIEVLELPALAAVRSSLQEGLGVEFKDDKGEHFFRSTLIQTLWYGVFSSWVLWSRATADSTAQYAWREAAWSLRVPMIRSLFEQVATPTKLGPLGLVPLLDWTEDALNRVDRSAFFSAFDEGLAVQYFYEPFLAAFDPELRKELGVWYTPPEVVRYQVAQVDRALREDLGIEAGLADRRVLILDPCCGTGTYLVEVARLLAAQLSKTGDGLDADDLKEAILSRIFGFEIMPAPFVVAHLQLALLLHGFGAPLSEDGTERAGVFLTNSLTGWGADEEELQLPFPEIEEEREAAHRIKVEERILVVIGNPPYNAFAGVSPDQERGLVDGYKVGLVDKWRIKKFNLDDLYVRFFRIAERRIANMSKRGIVCYISNFSYVSEKSFVVMRERFLREFDSIRIDSLNGDSRLTGKLTPDGAPDPSVFSTDLNREGIRKGTAICMLIRNADREPWPINHAADVEYRDFWGVNKRADLVESVLTGMPPYASANPSPKNYYSFRPVTWSAAYQNWPSVTELCGIPPINGLMEKRAGALYDLDFERLVLRMTTYFDGAMSWDQLKDANHPLTRDASRYVAKQARARILEAETYDQSRIVRYAVRPFDNRWAYYTPVRPLWNEPRPKLWAQLSENNAFLVTRPGSASDPEGVPFYFTPFLGDNDALKGHANYIPVTVTSELVGGDSRTTPNLSVRAAAYLQELGDEGAIEPNTWAANAIWFHVLALGFSPVYLEVNQDGIQRDWPRVPLPASMDLLHESARLGAAVADSLDPQKEYGQFLGEFRDLLRTFGQITRIDGTAIQPGAGHLLVTAPWSNVSKAGIVMPAGGKVVMRDYDEAEAAAIRLLGRALSLDDETVGNIVGAQTLDVYLNDETCWRNVPVEAWDYLIGGFPVLKKWLSYRTERLIRRELSKTEAREVSDMVRRIVSLLLLGPQLDSNYASVAAASFDWATTKNDAPIEPLRRSRPSEQGELL